MAAWIIVPTNPHKPTLTEQRFASARPMGSGTMVLDMTWAELVSNSVALTSLGVALATLRLQRRSTEPTPLLLVEHRSLPGDRRELGVIVHNAGPASFSVTHLGLAVQGSLVAPKWAQACDTLPMRLAQGDSCEVTYSHEELLSPFMSNAIVTATLSNGRTLTKRAKIP